MNDYQLSKKDAVPWRYSDIKFHETSFYKYRLYEMQGLHRNAAFGMKRCVLVEGHLSKETYYFHLLGTHFDNLQCNQLIVAIAVIEGTTMIQITFLNYLKCTSLPSYRVPPQSGHYKL
jgi:hypothetical protein